ncbi:GH25 family lysozyme [Weissella confusa]|uniref:GH25 family lysozyme n=1 Tax=Weissella confusa TaxID=1583 RepID=UPI0021A620DA|nr:GH25 family lysozyme [Weissella confusa]MCT2911175.1 lysin [Weissella confusa]
MNKLLKSALASAGALLIMGSVPSVHAAKGDQGVDWSVYQGSQGKLGYGHDKFAIAQIGGYHGYIYDQSTYATQVQYAIAQGKRAHTYMWWQDITDYATADKVLDYFLPKVQTPKGSIVALDVESGGQNTDVIMHALQRIKDAGYTPMVYGYKNYLQASTDLQRIANSYELWLAEYPNYEVTPEPNYNYFPSFDNVGLFQFTSTYVAGGLDGNVDLSGITDNGYKNGNPSKPNTDTPAVVAGKEADNTPKSDIAPGMTVKVNFSATHYATGEAIPNYVKGEPHKVLEVDGDRVLLDDIYSWVSKKNVEILDANTQDDSAEFNGVFYLDSWQYELGGVYVRNNDMAIPVADYHNDMPVVSVTLTDRFGNPVANQNGLGNNGVPEYFTLNGRYKVLQRVGSSIEVEMNGETVWLKAVFAN